MCPSSARETALFARDASTKRRLIGCRVVFVPPRTAVNFTGRKKKAKKKRENAKALFDDDPPCRSTRAPERLRSRRACFLETWMRRTFLSRESRVLVFSRIPERKKERNKRVGRWVKKNQKERQKKARRRPQPTLYFRETAQKSENFLSRRRRSQKKFSSFRSLLEKKPRERREDRPTLQKWCVLPLPRFLPL